MHPPLPSHQDLADATGKFLAAHPVFGPWVPLATGFSYAVMSVIIPDEAMPYIIKVALAFPVGILTGLGSGLAAWIIKKIIARKAAK